MYEALLLPGQPPIKQETVETWTRIQRGNWLILLDNIPSVKRFVESYHDKTTTGGIHRIHRGTGDYVVSFSRQGKEKPHNFKITRMEHLGQEPLSELTYFWTPGKAEVSLIAKNPGSNFHRNSELAVAFGILEYTRFRQGVSDYERLLARIKS